VLDWLLNAGARGDVVETRIVDRLAVRALVQKHVDELHSCARAGGNTRQKALDQRDSVAEMVADLSVVDQGAFYRVYAEEMDANTDQVESFARQNQQQIALDEDRSEMFWKAVGVVLIAALALFLIVKFAK